MKVSLKFKNPNLESLFIAEYNERSLSAMRLGYCLSIFLYSAFGLLDIIMMPISHHLIWIIRFGIVIPITLIFFSMTFFHSLRNYMQAIVSLNAIIMGLGIVSMIAIADASEPGFNYYYAGLMLVIMGICSLFRLRFFYALFSSSVIILGYEVTAIFIQRIYTGLNISNDYLILINNNFFYISANIIGLMAAYYLEYLMRVKFLQQQEIIEKHQDLINLMGDMKMELGLAKHIQSNLLPAECPYLKNIKIYSIYKPMEDLGGDFYDFIRFVEHNLLGIFVSDVSGHGIPAALITSMMKTLNITAGHCRFSTSEFLQYINFHLTGQIGDNFLTSVYMVYDSETRIMKYSRAGHPFPLLIRDGEITLLKSKGGIIGIKHEISFEELSIELVPGDRILIYTDGLTEEINIQKTPFESIFFEEVLPSVINKSIEEISTYIYQRLIDFKGDEKLSDDVCIVGIEIV